MPEIRNIHQMQVAAATENSIGNEVLELQAALRGWGYRSEIYAEEIAPSMRGKAQHYSQYRPSRSDLLILHYSTGSRLTDFIRTLPVQLILFYHNVTPPGFLIGVGRGESERARRGMEALAGLRDQTLLALARSRYSRDDLIRLGFDPVQVLPVIVPETLSRILPDEGLLARYRSNKSPNLLFVGRIVPNKCQEDVIKCLYFYHQIDQSARLFLVGSFRNTQRYADWLRQFAVRFGLGDLVHLCGHVSNAELAAYYGLADVFVCMSEHEGFGIPLVEAMRMKVPIIAYASTAIPETIGDAGVLILRKEYSVIAELIHLLHTDRDLRNRIVTRQLERARSFAPTRVLRSFRAMLHETLAGIA